MPTSTASTGRPSATGNGRIDAGTVNRMTNQLESLRQHSVIVADTGDIDAIARFRPQHATTTPKPIHPAIFSF